MVTKNYNISRPKNEQDLVEDLIIEAIQAKGSDVNYILREQVDTDLVLGESPSSRFTEYVVIEMYLDLVTQYNGDGDIFSGFGMSYSDHAEFLVSSRRFKEEFERYGLGRPREGDLIYLPASDTIWEISKVKEDHQYYQLGKNYQYRIITNIFQYSDEEIETGYEIDITNPISINLDSDGVSETLGIKYGDPRNRSDVLDQESADYNTFDPNNPFSL